MTMTTPPATAPLRFGILGAARIAPAALVRPARHVTDARVVAVAARDRDKAARFARKHGIETVHGSYDALLADANVDAVYNPLPNGLHGKWTRAALAAGKHVLCEKPFTANADEAVEVAAVAASSGRVVVEAFHYRYHPLAEARARHPRRSASSAACATSRPGSAFRCPGSPTSATTTRSPAARSWTPAATPSTWRASSAARSPRSSPRPPSCTGPTSTAPCAPSCASQRTHRHRALLDVAVDAAPHLRARNGDKGELAISNPVMPQLWHKLVVRAGGRRRVERFTKRPTYEFQLQAFCDTVLRGAPTRTPPADAVANMRVIDAIYRAAGMQPRQPVT